MRTNFKDEELKVMLDKSERDGLRHARNLTRELARYTPDAAAVADGLTVLLGRIGEDGEYVTKAVESGSTDVVSGKAVIDAGGQTAETTSGAGRKAGGR